MKKQDNKETVTPVATSKPTETKPNVDLTNAAPVEGELVPDDHPETAVATRGAGGIVPANTFLADTEAKMTRAYLGITYGVGDASLVGMHGNSQHLASGPQGNKSFVELVPINIPLIVLCTGFREVWREYKKYVKGDAFPREFDTAATANAEGLTTAWTGPMGAGTPPGAAPCLYLDLLVRKPKDVESQFFCLKLDNEWYAPAWARLDKGLHKRAKESLELVVTTDASRRGVPKLQGRPDSVFLTLTTYPYTDKKGNARASLVVGQLQEGGKVCRPSDTFTKGLIDLMTNIQPADPDDIAGDAAEG
jgi:hypothetical protein